MRLLTAGLWVSGGLLLGRAAGFLREASIAALFGASDEADVLITVLSVPDLLTNILAGGALSAALIPEFVSRDPVQGRRLLVQTTVALLLLFMALAVALHIAVEPLLRILAPGFGAEKLTSAVPMLGIALYLLPLTVAAGVSTAWLQAGQRFAVPALGTLMVNACILLGIWASVSEAWRLEWVAVALVFGGLCRWASQLLAVGRPLPLQSPFGRQSALSAPLIKRYAQALLAGGFLLLLPVVGRALASMEGEGGVALFNYAQRLVEFPLALGLSVLAVVMFPEFSRAFSTEDRAQGNALVGDSVLFTLSVAFAMVLPLVWFAPEIVQLVFGWGSLSIQAMDEVALVASIGFAGMPAAGLLPLLAACFNAQRDTATPMLVSFGVLLAFFPAAMFLRHVWGLAGVMFAMASAQWLAVIALAVFARWRLGLRVGKSIFTTATLGSWFCGLLLFIPVAWFGRAASDDVLTGGGFAALGFVIAASGVFLSRRRYRDRLLQKVRKAF